MSKDVFIYDLFCLLLFSTLQDSWDFMPFSVSFSTNYVLDSNLNAVRRMNRGTQTLISLHWAEKNELIVLCFKDFTDCADSKGSEE